MSQGNNFANILSAQVAQRPTTTAGPNPRNSTGSDLAHLRYQAGRTDISKASDSNM